ncbi:MAG: Lrp/AsnC family transcriptional regulator [Desulfovibrio sp.]|uniref:Lrp/AsnC family transcriptional regulator n=1 Tax=Desulfovibrio sp. 7SRBS1 TaxID=3378064 RepID=UPI003B3FAB44
MVTAIVLLKVQPRKVNDVANALLELDGVSEVYSVGGRYDIVAMVRAKDNDDLAATVTEGCLTVDGIEQSETLIAFRAFSRHDLEHMFSLGGEE